MALVEAAVAEYARALWEQAAPYRLRWLRHVLRKVRPVLSRLAVRTFEPDEVLLEQYIRQFSLDFPAPDLTGVLEELGQKIAIQYGFLPNDPRAVQLEREFRRILEGDLFTYWRGLTDPRSLARRLAELRRQNQSTQRIIEKLQLEYAADYFTAERVVRTLYTAGANNAQLAALKDQGYTHKRWLTARDNRVRVAQGSSRFDHRRMDGVTVPIDEPFVTPAGSRLMYPGDRSLGAPAGEVVNCRCTVVGVMLGSESARFSDDAPEREARPRASVYRRAGLSLSVTVAIPSGQAFRSVRLAVQSAARVHGYGSREFFQVRVRRESIRDEDNRPAPAAFEYDQFSGVPDALIISNEIAAEAFEVLHELGHQADLLLSKMPGQFASQTGELSEWWAAVKASQAYQHLKSLSDGQIVALQRGTQTLRRRARGKDLEYFLRPQELFARSYAQYVAATSQDTVLLRQLGRRQSHPDAQRLYTEQWLDDDFEPIAQALERIFEERGWLRRE
jgi:hypothetical protein